MTLLSVGDVRGARCIVSDRHNIIREGDNEREIVKDVETIKKRSSRRNVMVANEFGWREKTSNVVKSIIDNFQSIEGKEK